MTDQVEVNAMPVVTHETKSTSEILHTTPDKKVDQRALREIAQVVYTQQNIRSEIRDVLEKFDFRPLERREFATLVGITTDEMTYLDLFWDPAFNKGWLYLSDDIIKSQLTNETGADALKNFNNRVLLANDYALNVDYKRIEYDDPLIVLYMKTRWSNLTNEIKLKKITNKAYYAVSGETYLDLLARASTEGGKLARATFRKVANAARMMFEYINVMNVVITQSQLKECETRIVEYKDQLATADKSRKDIMLAHCIIPDLGNLLYVFTCRDYHSQKIYKIGHTALTPKTRLSGLNSSRLVNDALVPIRTFQCRHAAMAEKFVHNALHIFRHSEDREFFQMSLLDIIIACENAVRHTNEMIDEVNDQTRVRIETPTLVEDAGLVDASIFDTGARYPDMSSPTDDVKQQFLTRCIEEWCAAHPENPDSSPVAWKHFQVEMVKKLYASRFKRSEYEARKWRDAADVAAISLGRKLSFRG